MARKITTKGDDISLMLKGSGFEAVDKLLDIAAPKTKKLIQDEFDRILENARKEWLVRGAKPPTPEQQKTKAIAGMVKSGRYTKAQAEEIADRMEKDGRFSTKTTFEKSEKSKDSKGKLKLTVRVNKQFELVASLTNTAPYAWAIKVGENSDTTLAYGTRIADELLWKPAKKITDKIAESMANEILRTIK
jgi:hypothetical protein